MDIAPGCIIDRSQHPSPLEENRFRDKDGLPFKELLCRLALIRSTLVLDEKAYQYIRIDADYVLRFHSRQNMASTPQSISCGLNRSKC